MYPRIPFDVFKFGNFASPRDEVEGVPISMIGEKGVMRPVPRV
jgi:hypothetical protein